MRYSRPQQRIDLDEVQAATIAVIGAGATGSHIIDHLTRLGSNLVIVDRDYVAEENLATSTLYTEDHVNDRVPKAVAAETVAHTINSDVEIAAHVTELIGQTIDQLLGGVDLVIDATDNMETRLLLNEYAVREQLPWIHTAALGYQGTVLPIIPGETACLSCVYGDVDGSRLATCETGGIDPATAAMVGGQAVSTAIQLLAGSSSKVLHRIHSRNGTRSLAVTRQEDCITCASHEFSTLNDAESRVVRVCGEDTYHFNPHRDTSIDLNQLSQRLADIGSVDRNQHLLRFENADAAFTVFRDGRAIIRAKDAAGARRVYDRFVGR